jgi:glyoxylase-like metal-dependent hydrolase (beta-lactamase superfamily II)
MIGYHFIAGCCITANLMTGAYSNPTPPRSCGTPVLLDVKSHVNLAEGLDVVSSLIIGSQAAVIVDLPWTITKAKELAQWVKETTDKPLVAAFSSHSHPDHYLSGGAFLDEFPGIKYYANPRAAAVIKEEAPQKVCFVPGNLDIV